MAQTAALTGATGFVGRYTVRELLDRGWRIRALVRSRQKARKVLPHDDRLHLIEGDSLQLAKLDELVDGAQACINTLGIIREAPGGQTFRKLHIQSVQALVDACSTAGVQRLAHISAMGVSESGRAEYQRSKWQGEQIIRTSGIPWTIVRPSTIHGPDGEFVQQVKGWVTGRKAPWYFLPYFTRGVKHGDVPLAPVHAEPAKVAPVAVEDVAWALAECLERPHTVGEIYNLSGPEVLTWPEMLILFRDSIPNSNRNLHPMGIPSEIAALHARFATKLGLGGLMPFDEGMATMGAEDVFSERHKALAHLDFQPVAFSERLPQYAAQI